MVDVQRKGVIYSKLFVGVQHFRDLFHDFSGSQRVSLLPSDSPKSDCLLRHRGEIFFMVCQKREHDCMRRTVKMTELGSGPRKETNSVLFQDLRSDQSTYFRTK